MEILRSFVILGLVSIAIGMEIVNNFTTPTTTTSTNVAWDLSLINYLGLELHPGTEMTFEVPLNYQKGIVRNIYLTHRKDSKFDASVTYNSDGTFYDSQGAYDDISCFDPSVGYARSWTAKKFAEPRSPSQPEVETLHDWVYYVDIFSTNMIYLKSATPVSKPLGVANIHKVEIEFFPTGEPSFSQVEIYSPGTTFINFTSGQLLPTYGGGPLADLSYSQMETEGLYPDAVAIGTYGKKVVVSDNVYVDYYGNMHIKIPAGKKLGGFEISIGDTKYDINKPPSSQVNKDGGYGALGWAKITATLSVSDETCLTDANVPPSGVISGGPQSFNYITKNNEEIVVSSTSYAWVMAYKVDFMK